MIDLYAVNAREKYGLSDDWHIHKWECGPSGTGEYQFIFLTGSICPLKQSGKFKGRPDWKKRDRNTEQTVVLMLNEHKEWKLTWEQRTGLCHLCTGDGVTLARGWMDGKELKKEFRACRRCNGTKVRPVEVQT